MLNIGRINHLKVNRLVDFGAYLDSTDGREILLPSKYFDKPLAPGDEVDVFVYNDSEDRLIATTQRPKAMVGEFAYMRVAQVNSIGAFLDWGITAKDLLVPYREQKARMREDGTYLVYVYLDDASKRIVGSSKIEKFVGNVLPHYKSGDKVEALVIDTTDRGYRTIVDNLHYGMIYSNQVFKTLHLGDKVEAYVHNVRDDGKIDLMLGDRAARRTSDLASTILESLRSHGGWLPLTDKSSPEDIQRQFSCSKKDFKKAVGHLYKDHKILIHPGGLRLID